MKPCRNCGTPTRNKTYCSKSCYNIAISSRQIFACENCGAAFEKRHSPSHAKPRFCSRSCKTIHQWSSGPPQLSGSDNPNWTGGTKNRTQKKARKVTAYKKWQEAVRTRDNRTCQDCGFRGARLHAHHLLSFSDYKDLRFEIWNGITLCRECHEEVHERQTCHA